MLAVCGISPEGVTPDQDLDSILRRLERFGVRLGLETTQRLLAGLGDPQHRLSVVLVAGTNGKGSTAALLASMASAAGYSTGLYTSPHLEVAEERIRIDGAGIERVELEKAVRRVVETADRVLGHPPTYFEALTAAAFLHFADRQVDLAVLEVGMGGRLDATNVSEPILSLITPIGLDHQEFLGGDLTSIATEKAGVMRAGRPVICWLENAETRRTIEACALAAGAELVVASDCVELKGEESFELSQHRVEIETEQQRYVLEASLLGTHQQVNLAMAVLAAEALADLGFADLGIDAIQSGARALRWPGRLERVDLPNGGSILLDVAHNPAGAAALASFLAGASSPYCLLYGSLDDKDVATALPLVARRARRVVLTSPESPRALSPERMESLISGLPVEVAEPSSVALDRALAGDDGLLVVCGSVFLVGEIRTELRGRFGVPPSAVDIYTRAG